MKHTGLSREARLLVRVSAALSRGDDGDVRAALALASERCAPRQVEEALLQSYLFLGYPAALNAMAVWREISGHPAPAPAEVAWPDWEERGAAVCETVYGGQYAKLRANVRRFHPDLETWMVVEGYGKVLGRPGLELGVRELCIVAILAPRGPAVLRQLHSHLRGALNAGVSRPVVGAALEEALVGCGDEVARPARELWARLSEGGSTGA